ncbi:MAG: ferritin-like domain-containing protein [Candidatus Eremiobacteraeota bacterium]|nr:ferritin-like domain-containing protein [Candidatus Eremiobacteraeota bacterium]
MQGTNGYGKPRLLIGSEAHKQLFCRTFMESHERFEPTELPWPALDERSLKRLRSLPFWEMALQAETNAGAMVTGFGATIVDPTIREAVELQGFEEGRHGRLIATMVERYGLGAVAGPPQLEPTERAFIHFGYSECLDSFVGFGLFRIAQELEFLPDALCSLFTRVLWEEARHIVFFVNWIAYERVQRGYGNPLMQAIATAIGYVRAVIERIVSGRAITEKNAENRSAEPLDLPSISLLQFLHAAIHENDRFMARFDERLLRPRVMPALARGIIEAANTGRNVRGVFSSRAS